MGNCVKPKVEKPVKELTDEAINFLEVNTNLDKETILEWHKNFLVYNKIFCYYLI